jgi:hypothetical protein
MERTIGELIMPLPDADKKSPRVYTNLQNLDLDTVTFANIQSTGNPINVEEANEDELRRLVLVNLARLVTAGEWNGLLQAGGGTISPTALKAQSYNSTRDQYVLGNGVVWGATAASTAVGTELSANYTLYRPFIAPNSGTIADVNMWVNTAAAGENVEFGIYANDDDTGLPTGSVLTKCDLSLGSTGLVTQSSLTGTATLTRGTQYWFGYVPDTSSTSGRINGFDVDTVPSIGAMAQNPLQQRTMIYDGGGTANQLDATVTTTTSDWVSVQYDVGAFSVTFS